MMRSVCVSACYDVEKCLIVQVFYKPAGMFLYPTKRYDIRDLGTWWNEHDSASEQGRDNRTPESIKFATDLHYDESGLVLATFGKSAGKWMGQIGRTGYVLFIS